MILVILYENRYTKIKFARWEAFMAKTVASGIQRRLRMKRRIISMWMAIILLLTTVDMTAFATQTVSENGMQNGSNETVSDSGMQSGGDGTVSDNDKQNGSGETEDTGEEEGTLSSNEPATVSGQCGDNITWGYEDGILTITGTGDMWHYDMDENLSPWNEYREEITQLILDENITRIGSHAFYGCSNLSGKLKISGNVETIGTYAFWGCTGLTGLELSEGIIRITEGAFGGCTGLSGDLIIPDGVEVIAEWAFEGCRGLSGLEIPDGMETICTRAFASCEGITRIVFQGEKPEFASYMGPEYASEVFGGITADVYYPADDLTWDGIESVEGLGGDLTWIAVQPEKQKVDAPDANIESGIRINEETIIQLTTETLDAKIYYTTDGTKPVSEDGSPNGKLYTDGVKAKKVMQPAKMESGESVVTIKAYAVKEGYADSKVVTFRYAVESESSRWGDIIEQDRILYATEAMPQGDASKVPSGMWIAGIREEGYTYSGNNIVFAPGTEDEIRVYDGKTLLKLNQDYTISYKNNKKAYEFKEGDAEYKTSKAPTVTIKGKGNYNGTIIKNFVILPADLTAVKEDGTAVYQVSDITLAYNGKVQKGTTKVTYTDVNGKVVSLKANTDFFYVYPGTDSEAEDYSEGAFKEARKEPYEVQVVGKGNYTGTITFKETITESTLISKVKVASIPVQQYKKGEPATPELTLTYKGETLVPYNAETKTGDYALFYEDHDKPGTARVIIHGKGEFAGERIVTFKIKGYELKKAKMEGFVSSYIYTGDAIKQDTVKFYGTDSQGNNVELTEKIHYTATYDEEKNTNVGTATVTYTGNPEEGWTGTIKKTYKIKAYDLNSDTENRITVTDEEGNAYPLSEKYQKNGAKPSVKVKYTSPKGKEYILAEGKDYKLSYSNNKKINDGTDEKKVPTVKITGKGNFRGTRQKETFKITVSDISQLSIEAADVVYQNKAGKFTTNVVIKDTDGKKLKAGTDYEKNFEYYYGEKVKLSNGEERAAGTQVEETDIVLPGTVLKVVVTGKGNYAGNGDKAAVISDLYRVVEANIAKATVKVNKQYYTGKPICPDKSQIVITMNGKVLSPQDYKIVSYTNNMNKGTAKLTVKGVGSYGGTKTVNFTIANKTMDCIISFNANGATSGSMKDMKIKYGTDYTLTKNTYKKDGYDFKGWNTEYDGTGVDAQGNAILYEDEAKNPISISKNDIGKIIILYAQWELTKYEIKYELDGGINHEQNPATYTVEDKVELKEPTKEGYVFLGWYTDSGFSASKKISMISKGTKGDKVLYAKWRATSIKDVEVPETYLNVNDYGAIANDDMDDTNIIENIIELASENAKRGGINTVYVPAGTYIITPGDANEDGDPGISLKSNVNLVMDNDAILYVKETSFDSYCVISAKYVENISITGGKILGERYRHLGTPDEYGHGIAIYAGKNIEISNVLVSDNCGDGIYLGTQAVRQPDDSQAYFGCENISIRNCEIINNRRNNISIVDADDVLIDQCYIADANGTAPQCGICIEPNYNSSDGICRNITIKDTTVNAYQNKNSSNYMCFMTVHNPNIANFVTADNIKFINCTFNGWVGNYSGTNLQIDSNTVINGEFVNLKG